MKPVDSLHQLTDGRNHRIELDADRSILPGGLDDDREFEIVRKIEPAPERTRKDGGMNAVELENLLGHRLVLPVEQSPRAGAGDAFFEQFEVGGNAVVGRIVAAE